MSTFEPDYLNLDFTTIKSKIKEELANSDRFRDYDYEGSNIAVLIEVLAYIAELHTYYQNRIAKNVYLSTADQYENVNRLARQYGYEPRGYRSARTSIKVTVTGASPDEKLIVDQWTQIDTGQTSPTTNQRIYFAVTNTTSGVVTSAGTLELVIPIRQGRPATLSNYKGSDIVDNRLTLPSNYAYDDDIDDDYPVMTLSVNDEAWTRISDFYDRLSPLYDEDDVYMMMFNKYQDYQIVFNESRNVPSLNDEISITVLRSLGSEGAIGANLSTWTTPASFIYRESDGEYLVRGTDYSTLTLENSASSYGSSDPETIEEIRDAAKGMLHAQYRNVSKYDYSSHLETRADVARAIAWGEQDIAPSGNVLEYNKVHISVIPSTWGSSTITTSAGVWTTSDSVTGSVFKPIVYSSAYMYGSDGLKNYLSSRKMLTVYEEFELPELIWFSLNIGLRIKRTYSYANVVADLKEKLTYYFSTVYREFNQKINFYDVVDFLKDLSNVSSDSDFENVRGVKNLIIRDIDILNTTTWSETIYETNSSGNYPQYTTDSYGSDIDNRLREIELGYYQFPMLSLDTCVFEDES